MNRKLIAFAFFLIFSFTISAEEIQISSYEFIIKAIESYLNNGVLKDNSALYLFICKRNDKYHNGYEPAKTGLNLSIYPYASINRIDVPMNALSVDISIDYSKMNIIINIRLNGKWYGFICKIENRKQGYRLIDVPNKLREND